MRRMGRTLAYAILTTGVGLAGGGGSAMALTGACKVRDSSAAVWSSNGMAFEACKALNQQRDGDNVFDERGLVWWNVKG